MASLRSFTAAWLSLSACLLLQACSGVRLQSWDEFSGSVYSTEQSKARKECLRYSSAAELADCQKSASLSYQDYKKEREKVKDSGR
ncbi:hypothetical protein LNV09_21790 [Paucibacter sp. B2R-40]|uniref:hypothetical protein n=1 Tax=Paucibacter sp. B2R-40 TaxID=2893554 RepID=UPI0021E3FB02|nr:hypothetical protein [Paucibacter sp. B2R-40]MCV2356781.1 hypothetical protein [Paucibacter sp. B2R-40]